ncbi:hypothetical protein E2C01_030569 [Portunus trituberculatus]|uniref:Uncharacterized protein n=1 Tax=Portunus trituberculatus TaxID=210409 RepID=A0A5B7EUK5_PORTR|nr:hypothetical protein [Portunus trituberculatus]
MQRRHVEMKTIHEREKERKKEEKEDKVCGGFTREISKAKQWTLPAERLGIACPESTTLG